MVIVELGRGELTRLCKATDRSLVHLHFVLRGKRKPSAALAQQLDDLNPEVGKLLRRRWPDLFPEERKEVANG